MTFMLGTGHAVYSVMPIIGDVALKNNIRPERPMAAASVASQLRLFLHSELSIGYCHLHF